MTIDQQQTLDRSSPVILCDVISGDVVTAEGGRVPNFPDQADKKEAFYRDAGQELHENTTGAKCLISSRLVFCSVSTDLQDFFPDKNHYFLKSKTRILYLDPGSILFIDDDTISEIITLYIKHKANVVREGRLFSK